MTGSAAAAAAAVALGLRFSLGRGDPRPARQFGALGIAPRESDLAVHQYERQAFLSGALEKFLQTEFSAKAKGCCAKLKRSSWPPCF